MKKKIVKRFSFSAHLGLLIVTCILAFLGLLFVFESSVAQSYQLFDTPYHFVMQHAYGLLAGLSFFFLATLIPSKLWLQLAPVLYIVGLILLILVFVPPIGLRLNGAHRWIGIAGITFQSVEFFKFACISYLALWLSKKKELIPFFIILVIPAILLILQPDLGSLLLLLGIAITMFYLAGGSMRSLSILAITIIPAATLAVFTSPYRMKRLTTFLNPESDPLGASFHIKQITLALGRGGLFGQGIGNSRQKFAYIPEVSTDSIFAIVAEEIGFLGSLVIFGLFLAFFYFAITIVTNHKLAIEQRLLGLGIIAWISYQTLLNLGAVVALIPLTGIPLPFFSYGRSAQLMILFSTGILYRLGKES